jgi:hypothetical protein
MAMPAAPLGICRLCHRRGPTRPVIFRQNVGVILLRFAKKVEGPLCRRCIESTFSDMTLITFFAGWWGIVSIVVTPFLLVSNIVEYTSAIRSPELRNAPSSGKGSKAIAAMVAVAALAVLAVSALVVGLALLVGSAPSGSRRAGAAAAAGLREAEAKILVHGGQAAHGNTPDAQRYAAAYSERMALVRGITFTGGRGENAPSLTEGRFLTYCELRQGKICFLVHVPELRSYAANAREALARIAWTLAQQTVESRSDAATLRLGVGLRGLLLYGVVMTGTAQGPMPPVRDVHTPLEAFFTGPLAPSEDAGRLADWTAPTPPTAEPTPPLPLQERLKRDIEAIGLSDSDPRLAAARDLERLGLEAVPALLNAAQDQAKNVEARATSMHLLGRSGSPEAIPALLRCLEDPGAGHAAGEGLRHVKDAETSVLPRLANGIEKRCVRPVEGGTPAGAYCWNALNTLGAFKTAAGFAAPVVLKVLAAQPPGLGLHTTAITAAGSIGPAAKDAVPFMITGLKHPDSYVKQESIRALERIGPEAQAAISALEELRRIDPETRADEIDKALASIRGTATPRP